jgi:hypothetical protein
MNHWTRTPNLLCTLWKTLALVSSVSCHAPRACAILAKFRTWNGPYYQSLEPCNLASSWTQTKDDFYYSPLHSFQIRHVLPFSILLCWSGDGSWDNLAKSSYKQNMEVKIFKHPSILFAAYWNLTQKCNDVFRHIFEIWKVENPKKLFFLFVKTKSPSSKILPFKFTLLYVVDQYFFQKALTYKQARCNHVNKLVVYIFFILGLCVV